jgi:hypothetical protein
VLGGSGGGGAAAVAHILRVAAGLIMHRNIKVSIKVCTCSPLCLFTCNSAMRTERVHARDVNIESGAENFTHAAPAFIFEI